MAKRSKGERRARVLANRLGGVVVPAPGNRPELPPGAAGGSGEAGERPEGVVSGKIEAPGSQAWRAAFLAAYANSGNVRAATLAARVSRDVVGDLEAADPLFRAEKQKAFLDFVDMMRAQAVQRANNGSDKLLMFLLRAHEPETYARDKTLKLVPGMGEEPRPPGAPLQAVPVGAMETGAVVRRVHVYLPDNGRDRLPAAEPDEDVSDE